MITLSLTTSSLWMHKISYCNTVNGIYIENWMFNTCQSYEMNHHSQQNCWSELSWKECEMPGLRIGVNTFHLSPFPIQLCFCCNLRTIMNMLNKKGKNHNFLGFPLGSWCRTNKENSNYMVYETCDKKTTSLTLLA